MRLLLCLFAVWTVATLPAHAQALKWIASAVRTKNPTPKPAEKPLYGEKQVDLKPVLVDEKPAASPETRKKAEPEKPEPKKSTPVPKPTEKPVPKKPESAREPVPAAEPEKKDSEAKKESVAKEPPAKEPAKKTAPEKPASEPSKKTVSAKKKEPVRKDNRETPAPKKAEASKETASKPDAAPAGDVQKKPAPEPVPAVQPAAPAVVPAPEGGAVKAQSVTLKPVQTAPVPQENPVPGAALFRPGDVFELRLSGMPAEDALPFALQFTIGTDGFVNIPLGGLVRGAGLTQSQLESAIEKRLVEREIFTRPTATINVAPQSRFVTVGGQVRVPQRLPWTADLTLLSAISAVGGPADFAGGKIKLTRAGKVEIFSKKDLDRRPEKDPRLLPGDQIEQL
jgi:protein involved in polysaccharide export with SLBB domain